jgi:hypothetical protein
MSSTHTSTRWGSKRWPLAEFAEEVRDVHIYTGFLPFHREGEVLVKMHVPAPRIERFEKYNAQGDLVDLDRNEVYEAPEQYANVRELL